MTTLYNGFIGHRHKQQLYFLEGEDPEESFQKNLLTQSIDWEYRNKQILYSYNSLGHRSCELSSLDKNYILFSGCSFTEGLGLCINDSYTTLVSNHLEKQSYNLGLGGSSPSIAVKNIMLFLTTMKEKHPDYIIIQWPYFWRYYGIIENYIIIEYTSQDVDNSLYEELLKNDHAFYYNCFERLNLLHFLHNLGFQGQLIEIFSQTEEEYEKIKSKDWTTLFTNKKDIQLPTMVDRARDLCHPGSKTNKVFADAIIKIL
jgi:hypothetical protein